MSRCEATKNGHRCHSRKGHKNEHFAVVLPNKYLCWKANK